MKKITFLIIATLFGFSAFGQQDVFSRDNVTTGNFGDAQEPWYYATSNNTQGDPDNGNTIRNFIKIGHNNNTTMTTNGRFYICTSFDFQAGASVARTINNSGGGLSASGGIYNGSTAIHTFNTPIGIDGSTVQLHVNSSGGLIFNETIFINSNTVQFGNLGTGEIVVNGTMDGTGNVEKTGTNTLRITGNNIYSGSTTVIDGILNLQSSLANSDVTVQNGATLEIDGDDITLKSLTVDTGGTVIVNAGKDLTVTGNLTVNGSMTLHSTSSTFSSLIVNGTSTGNVTYNRYVNVLGSVASSGNDLIALPVMSSGQTFDAFIALGSPANSTKLASNATVYAFGSFNNGTDAYDNYPLASTATLVAGTGYRAATTSGETLTFVGPVNTGTVASSISVGAASKWNLVGNPYPSYLDAQAFLTANGGVIDEAVLDPAYNAVYGYNSSTDAGSGGSIWTIINSNQNTGTNIAPGQGFYVASNNSGALSFTPAMRVTTGADDFIQGRSAQDATNSHLRLAISNATQTYGTDFYFNDNSSLGLDSGYDAGSFDAATSDFSIYSHLVADNTGIEMAIQSLATNDMNDVVVPLGIHAPQGQQLTVSIAANDLQTGTNVYLEDNVTNTWTLLNTGDYTITPSVELTGTGRFFVHFSSTTLSLDDNTLNGLQIYTESTAKTVVVKGQLHANTSLVIFDSLGRRVMQTELDMASTSHSIPVSNLATGMYIVKLQNGLQTKTQKVMIR